MMTPGKIILDFLKGPAGTEIVGDVCFSYRMRIIQLFWKPEGLLIGAESSGLEIKTVRDCIICNPGSIVSWSKLAESWSIGFIDGESFATGWTRTIDTLDDWMHFVPYLPSSNALCGLEPLLAAKALTDSLSWSLLQAVSNMLEMQVKRLKMPSAEADPIRNTIRFYSIPAALQEMSLPSPDPDIIAWLRDTFMTMNDCLVADQLDRQVSAGGYSSQQ